MRRSLASLVAVMCVACGDDTVIAIDAGTDGTLDATLAVGDSGGDGASADGDGDAIVDASCACDGSLPVCLDGTCVACAPGSGKCMSSDGGATAQTCDGTGAWQSTNCAQPSPDCDSGSCTCAGQVCNGTCIDVSSDSANCGRCGHDCCGGACVKGQCQVVTIAAGQHSGEGIAVDSSDVYWSNNWGSAEIRKCSVAGCSAPTTLLSAQGGISKVMVDSTSVYWRQGSILACSKTSCSTPTVLWAATSSSSEDDFTIDASNVYWNYGDILKCPLTGCAGDAGAPTVLSFNPYLPYKLAVDGANVYWSQWVGYGIYQCSLGGCGSTPTLYASSAYAAELALDSTNLYWVNSQTSTVMSCAKNGCITPSALTQGAGASLGVDSKYVYWVTNNTPYEMYACPTTGKCTLPVKVATLGPNAPYHALAMDDSCLYWATQFEVQKVAKP